MISQEAFHYVPFSQTIQKKFGDRPQNDMETWSEFKLCWITGCQLPTGKLQTQQLTNTYAHLFHKKKNMF